MFGFQVLVRGYVEVTGVWRVLGAFVLGALSCVDVRKAWVLGVAWEAGGVWGGFGRTALGFCFCFSCGEGCRGFGVQVCFGCRAQGFTGLRV